MKVKTALAVVTGSSPSSASTAIIATERNLSVYDEIVIDAILTGGTGGTLDVYLQRKLATDVWADWVHFPQIAAGASKHYTACLKNDQATLADVGGGTDATPAPSLAANTAVQVIPGGDVRVVLVANAGTSAGAAQSFYFTGYKLKT